MSYWEVKLINYDTFRIQLTYFFLKEQPSVNLALPPVGVHNTVEQLSQVTAV